MTLLTVDEAADRLATKPRFIRRLIAEKRIPYIKLGAHVRIDLEDLNRFVVARSRSPPAKASDGTDEVAPPAPFPPPPLEAIRTIRRLSPRCGHCQTPVCGDRHGY